MKSTQLSNASNHALSERRTPTKQEVSHIAKTLGVSMLVQKTYGKTPDELEKVADAFSLILADFTHEQIIQALADWIKTEREFPTPADIRRKIHPEREFKREVYDELKRRVRDGEFVTNEEKKYITDYVNSAVYGT